MDQVVLVALQKYLKDLVDTSTISPGVHRFDETLTFHISGSLLRSPNELYTPTTSIPLLETVAVLLERMGVLRDSSSQLLVEVMSEAIALKESGSVALAERLKDINAAMARVREVTGALPKKEREGKTKVDATVELVPVPAPVVTK